MTGWLHGQATYLRAKPPVPIKMMLKGQHYRPEHFGEKPLTQSEIEPEPLGCTALILVIIVTNLYPRSKICVKHKFKSRHTKFVPKL